MPSANGNLISQTRNGDTLYFLGDAQNSTIAMTNSSGAVTSAYAYYDPSQGRFLSRDTWAVDYQNPVELNRYGYTVNNPVNFSDPSGNVALIERIKIEAKISLTQAGIRTQLYKMAEGFVAGIAGYYIGLGVFSAIKAFSEVHFPSIITSEWISNYSSRVQSIFTSNFSSVAMLNSGFYGAFLNWGNYMIDVRMKENLLDNFGDSIATMQAMTWVAELGYYYFMAGMSSTFVAELFNQTTTEVYNITQLVVTTLVTGTANLASLPSIVNFPAGSFSSTAWVILWNTIASLASSVVVDNLKDHNP